MKTRSDVLLDDQVYEKVMEMGGSFTAKGGPHFVNNIGRAVVEGNDQSRSAEEVRRKAKAKDKEKPEPSILPDKTSYRSVYEAVCRLVQNGRFVQDRSEGFALHYGSRPEPMKVNHRVVTFTAVS